MGNRAHVIFAHENEIGPAVYLHWNGGPESIYAFLAELEKRGFNHERGRDVEYATARFVQVVGDFLGGSLSLGVTNGPTALKPEALNAFDPGDNGIYVVGWEQTDLSLRFVVRRFVSSSFNAPPRELTPEQVATERRMAERNGYAIHIGGFFDTLREAVAQVRQATE